MHFEMHCLDNIWNFQTQSNNNNRMIILTLIDQVNITEQCSLFAENSAEVTQLHISIMKIKSQSL